MDLVIDASVAVKWYVDEVLSREAEALLLSPVSLVAPDLLVSEVASTMWKKALRGEATPEQARRVACELQDHEEFELIPDSVVIAQAMEIALALRHPVYDCLYLACAERFKTSLVTADQRLCGAVVGTHYGSLVRPLVSS